MLQFARKEDSTDEIKQKLIQCRSIFESIIDNNEKRVKHILSKNPSAIHEKNENEETVLDVARNCENENIKTLILEFQ